MITDTHLSLITLTAYANTTHAYQKTKSNFLANHIIQPRMLDSILSLSNHKLAGLAIFIVGQRFDSTSLRLTQPYASPLY